MVARGTPVEYFKIQRGKHFTPVEQNKRLNRASGVNMGQRKEFGIADLPCGISPLANPP
jgi:hypothetical protein